MAQIPVNTIVNVNISVSPTFPARAGFGTLLGVTKETGVLTLAERIRSYASIDGVSADWGADTELYKLAQTYFGQSPKPTSFMAGIRFETAQAGYLLGTTLTDALTVFQAITDGAFIISIDGVENTIAGLDFSADTTFDEVATTIETAIQAIATDGYTSATVVYDTNHFVITSGTTGSLSSVAYLTSPLAGTDLSSLLKLDRESAIKADGVDAETITASLNALNEVNEAWYGLAFTKEIRDNATVNGENAVDAASAWVEARIKTYGTTTNNELAYNAASTIDIAYTLSQSSLNRTFSVYSSYPSEYPEVSVFGRAFSVDFTAGNPSITLKFKQLPGITVEGISYNKKSILDDKNCNAFIDVAGNFMFAEGVMVNGKFFDEVHGLDWLQNAIQTNVFGALYTNLKIPYTDDGIQILVQKVRNALAEGVDAGLLAPGEDTNGNFLSEGYSVAYVSADNVNQSDIEARQYNGISFIALGAGAIHGVTINGVFER